MSKNSIYLQSWGCSCREGVVPGRLSRTTATERPIHVSNQKQGREVGGISPEQTACPFLWLPGRLDQAVLLKGRKMLSWSGAQSCRTAPPLPVLPASGSVPGGKGPFLFQPLLALCHSGSSLCPRLASRPAAQFLREWRSPGDCVGDGGCAGCDSLWHTLRHVYCPVHPLGELPSQQSGEASRFEIHRGPPHQHHVFPHEGNGCEARPGWLSLGLCRQVAIAGGKQWLSG